jgi:MFS family permease
MSSTDILDQKNGKMLSIAQQRSAWFVLAVLLLFSIAAPLNQFKVPPILPILMKAFQLPVSQAGLLMSVFAVTGILLAIPAGFLFQRFGARVIGLIAGGSIVLGAAAGAASSSFSGLLASRVIEGIGTSFMAVLAPALIAIWFSAQKRGMAMGIWAAWVPLGSTIMLVLAPRINLAAGWQSVWWFGCLYALLATVLFVIFVKPSPRGSQNAPSSASAPLANTAQVLRNRSIWLISLTFAFFNMAGMSYTTYTPTFLNLVRGIPLAQAGLYVSVVAICSIFSGPLGGALSDRIGSRKRVFLSALALQACIMPLTAFINPAFLIVQVILQGFIGGFIPTNIFSSGVEAAGDERLSGLAMGVIMVGQNAGMLAGPILFGALIESAGGWPLAYISLSGLCLLGLLCGWLAKTR